MPVAFIKQVQKMFFDFINFPRTVATVSQPELIKLRLDGGIKLIDIATKSSVSKCMWLIQLITNPALDMNLTLATDLLGEQNGHKKGLEIFFCPSNYARYNLRHLSPFYKEAISAFSQFDLQRHVTLTDVPLQNYFYSRVFLDQDYKAIINPLRGKKRDNFFLYFHVLAEKLKADRDEPADARVLECYSKMQHISINSKEHAMLTSVYDYLPLKEATEYKLYNEAIYSIIYRDHHSTIKWQEYLAPEFLEWKKIWRNILNPLASEDTRSVIWEHLHLNFNTTASFNKWREANDTCPFCNQVPADTMHIILICPLVRSLWQDIHPFLESIHSAPLTAYEMAFGLNGITAPVLLRNWLTFKFRQIISYQEFLAHNNPSLNNTRMIKESMNRAVKNEVQTKYEYCCATNKLPFFTRHYQCVPNFVVIRPDNLGVIKVFNL